MHTSRAFAYAVKAADKKDPRAAKNSVAYQALQKIVEFYRIDTELKELPATDRLTQRQTRIKPFVEDFFACENYAVHKSGVKFNVRRKI